MRILTGLCVAVALLLGASAGGGEPTPLENAKARLAREENAQKRAARLLSKAARELSGLLAEIRAHRVKPTGDLLAAEPVRKSLTRIGKEHLPKVERGIYLARTGNDSGAKLSAALGGVAREQKRLVQLLESVLGKLERSAATGACLHRAEKILRDQIGLNAATKPVLRVGFGKRLADLPESVRRKLLSQAEEQLRIGREVEVLEKELGVAQKTGPAKQKPGIRAARKILKGKHPPANEDVAAMIARASRELRANNAAGLTTGGKLEKLFRGVLSALQAAVAGAEEVAAFDLLGPSLAELAGKDKELAALLKKLRTMIKEAELLKKKPEREELRKLQNMQDELNNMLVEINRDLPEFDNKELIAKLKEMLRNAMDKMAAAGEAINKGEDAEAILAELKTTLANIVLAEAELKALLASLAALNAEQQAGAEDSSKETPAGIALGLGLKLGGNQSGESGPGGVLNPTKKAREFGRNDWGKLPPAVREQLMQATKEKYPQEYQDLIELYFQNIAKGAR
jgi:hypothetical protein